MAKRYCVSDSEIMKTLSKLHSQHEVQENTDPEDLQASRVLNRFRPLSIAIMSDEYCPKDDRFFALEYCFVPALVFPRNMCVARDPKSVSSVRAAFGRSILRP